MNRRRRERREYMVQKDRELMDKEMERKKQRVEAAVDANKKIPHSLRGDAAALLNEAIYEGGVEDEHRLPHAMVTTSRDPSSQLMHFSKQLALVLNAEHVMRGQMREEEISDSAQRHGYTCVLIVHENRGRPAGLVVSHFPFGPTMRFTIIDHFMGIRSSTVAPKAYFVCDNMDGEVGAKIKERLALLFPRCDDARRIVSLVNRNDTLALRHYFIEKDGKTVLKKSFGMDLKIYEIRRGTFEMEGDIEWVYKPHMSSRRTKEEIGTAAVDE